MIFSYIQYCQLLLQYFAIKSRTGTDTNRALITYWSEPSRVRNDRIFGKGYKELADSSSLFTLVLSELKTFLIKYLAIKAIYNGTQLSGNILVLFIL